MAKRPTIYGPDGMVIDLDALTVEQGGPTTTGIRQVIPQHPSWGLSPEGLASILRESESTDPSRYYALCDDVEEREWHYRGVLSQRRSALAQMPVTVDPASEDKAAIEHADLIRSIMLRPEMTLAKFDIGDALGKGMAFVEMDWDTSAGQWMPQSLAWRDPTWFRYDQKDLSTPLIVNELGMPQPLTPYKWIVHRARLKSGIPIRDGLSRAAVWAWMFKNFDIKAWMIFLNKFGQPLRLGKYPSGSKKEERRALLAALRDMGLDAAAIIPEGMNVEFVDGNGDGGDAFKGQADYLDQQISKLVVGQTGTTDTSSGGLAGGNKVHEGVLASICTYDGIVLATTLNRDLVRPVIDLNFGPQKAYPAVKIGLGDSKDVKLIMENLWDAVDRGLEVEASQIYPLLSLTEPAKGKDVVLLKRLARPAPGANPGGSPPPGRPSRAAKPAGGGDDVIDEESAAAEDGAPAGDSIDALAAEMAGDFELLGDIRAQVEAAVEESTSFDELKARLEGLAKGPASSRLIEKLGLAIFNARLAGELGAPIGPTE